MIAKEIKQKEEEFLKESNAIERVYDDDSLQQAKYAWKYLMSQTVLSLGIILKTHKILMLHQEHLRPYERGYFRDIMVYVGGKPMLNAIKIHERLEQWCIDGMKENVDTKESHILFEKIHPFVDGNGRIGRMLMNWQRITVLKKSLLIIHEGKEQLKYYQWFK